MLSESDIQALWLTVRLACLVTIILLIMGTPIAWWLTRTQSKLKGIIGALVAMPLILPPSVLGFYLLLAMGPSGPLGWLTESLGVASLAFSFSGLVFASLIYSLPFMVQPLQTAFQSVGKGPLEAAATLRASPWQTFFKVVLPLSQSGYITAAVLTFAHTVGEFGVVLLIGGSIPGETRVASVQIYDHIESMQLGDAHRLAIVMVGFSFLVLWFLYTKKGFSLAGCDPSSSKVDRDLTARPPR